LRAKQPSSSSHGKERGRCEASAARARLVMHRTHGSPVSLLTTFGNYDALPAGEAPCLEAQPVSLLKQYFLTELTHRCIQNGTQVPEADLLLIQSAPFSFSIVPWDSLAEGEPVGCLSHII
jgi:hypothetical protein